MSISNKNPFHKALKSVMVIGSSTVICLFSTAGITRSLTQAIPNTQPRIQLAILLDTSSSMDGLIDQTRNQLWQVVNEFAQSKKNDQTPALEVAVYEYGNSSLSSEQGYVRQLNSLTRELDKVSESLFSLTTNGGAEYCGYVIDKAVTQLQWSKSSGDIKAIFIAGNEPFTQGPVAFKKAIADAKRKGIVVNTIHAGDYETGAQSGWKEAALLAAGNYMSIDQNHQIAHIVAPQDKQIAELNKQLNETYIPYGVEGKASAKRQRAQDDKNSGVSLGLLAKRVKSKISSFYDNANWDLVDAFKSGSVKLEELEEEQLPAAMKPMSAVEKQDYIVKKTEQREHIQRKVEKLSKDRDAYVAKEKSKVAEADVNTVDEALNSAVRTQGKRKGFVF